MTITLQVIISTFLLILISRLFSKNNEFGIKVKKGTDGKNSLLDSGKRRGWDDLRVVLRCVYYHMWSRSPVQVWYIRQGSQGWCMGMTLGDGMGRKVGGGSGWGTHEHPWLIHIDVWQKPLQCCKVISL